MCAQIAGKESKKKRKKKKTKMEKKKKIKRRKEEKIRRERKRKRRRGKRIRKKANKEKKKEKEENKNKKSEEGKDANPADQTGDKVINNTPQMPFVCSVPCGLMGAEHRGCPAPPNLPPPGSNPSRPPPDLALRWF